MATIELTFNKDLNGMQEGILIGHLLAVREGLQKSGMLKRINTHTQLNLERKTPRVYLVTYKMGGHEKIANSKLTPDEFTKAISKMPGYSQVKETIKEMEKRYIEFTSQGFSSTISLPLIILLHECFKQMGFKPQEVSMVVRND